MFDESFIVGLLGMKPWVAREELTLLALRQQSALEGLGVVVLPLEDRGKLRAVRDYCARMLGKTHYGGVPLSPEQIAALKQLNNIVGFWIERDKFMSQCLFCVDCRHYDAGHCILAKSRVDGGNAPALVMRFGKSEVLEQFYISPDVTVKVEICGPSGGWWAKKGGST